MIASLLLLLSGLALADEGPRTLEQPPARELSRPEVPELPFERYQLDNGLTVILSQDSSVPFVQVNLWYGVGSKDEVAGRTGFAHLFEHLMFQGSENMNADFFTPLQKIGAQVNGTTNFDRTNYFEGVPSEYLPLALWLEADRMGWLLPALTQEKLDNQKDVVRNERRQRYENTPYGEVWVWMMENVFPPDHPYHVPTIGRHEDIEAATMEDVSAFFKTWYVPNNASLSIVGDFEASQARLLVQRYFGDIPRGPQPSPRSSATLPADWLSAEKVVEKTDDVPHARVWLAWISPASLQPGDAELDFLSDILSSGQDSRLYRALVKDKQIARSVSAYQASFLINSVFVIEATVADGHDTTELVAAIDEVLAEVRASGPTPEEVDVSRLNWKVNFYGGLQTIAAKADLLNLYQNRTGDPGYLGKDLQRYLDATPQSIHEATKQWLPEGRRVVLHVRPEGGAQ